MKAVILAGGKGKRLTPYTTIFPKPLVPIGDIPILEVVIRQLRGFGFKEITLAVGHLSELIRTYFKNGEKWGIKLFYSREEKSLGTAAPLSLIKGLNDTFLVMNSDILTTLDYTRLISFHKRKKGIATIASHERHLSTDFGIIRRNKQDIIVDYQEKPVLDYLVSMGIYIFEPEVLKYIRPGEKLDFPELVKKLIRAKKKVYSYISGDYWLDIGRESDYKKAIEDFPKMKKKFIGNFLFGRR